jgi:hypothetical protein
MHTEPINRPVRIGYEDDGGGRWYPTLLALANGKILVVGGHPSQADHRHSNFMLKISNRSHSPNGVWIDRDDEP